MLVLGMPGRCQILAGFKAAERELGGHSIFIDPMLCKS